MVARTGGLPEKVTRYSPDPHDFSPPQVRSRSIRLAKALLQGQTHSEGVGKVFRARNGVWILRHADVTIASWDPRTGRMQMRFANDGTIIDRLNGISAVWMGEIWFRMMSSPHSGNSFRPQYKFRNRHDVVGFSAIYTVTRYPAREVTSAGNTSSTSPRKGQTL